MPPPPLPPDLRELPRIWTGSLKGFFRIGDATGIKGVNPAWLRVTILPDLQDAFLSRTFLFLTPLRKPVPFAIEDRIQERDNRWILRLRYCTDRTLLSEELVNSPVLLPESSLYRFYQEKRKSLPPSLWLDFLLVQKDGTVLGKIDEVKHDRLPGDPPRWMAFLHPEGHPLWIPQSFVEKIQVDQRTVLLSENFVKAS